MEVKILSASLIQRGANDRAAPTLEEIQRPVEYSDRRINAIIYNMASSESNYLPFISGQQQQQLFSCISAGDQYTALILEEAEKIYNELMSKLTNDVYQQQ